MAEEKSIKELIEEMNKKFDELVESKQAKNWKMPWKARIGRIKAKKNWTTVLFINDNREVKFMKLQIDEQTVKADGTPRIASTDYMMTYKRKPFIIIPSWSVKPFSPVDNYEEAEKENMLAVGYRLLLNKMKSEVIKPKMSMSWGLIIVGILILGGVAYYLLKGGF